MIAEWGLFSLILALCTCVLGMVLPGLGLINQRWQPLQNLVRPAAISQCFFLTISFFALMICFGQDDFSVQYVAQNSTAQLPLIYKLCALWGAHEGSLLLWAFILTLWTMAVALYCKSCPPVFATRVLMILGAIECGFLLLLLHTSNPFLRFLPSMPEAGADLNPLLQDPGFVMHPPILYMGYVGFAVPFAFALAALWQGDPKIPWAQWARPWALLAWAFLTVGIVLGSWWAYYELGWGGWWFWDPVENASFMPWLVGVALTHAFYSNAQKKLFPAWCLLLALCAFTLSLIGTFLVRSGVLSSVHSFASDPLRGAFILGFLSIVMLGSLGLYLYRYNVFSQSEHVGDASALFTRGSFILLGNIIFFVAMLTILLGTLYPLALEVLGLNRISVGPPYFNAVFVPFMLFAMVLMCVAPYLHWGQESLAQFWVRVGKKGTLLLILMASLLFVLPAEFSLLGKVGIILGTLLMITALAKLKRPLSFQRLGMILAHCGFAFAVLGATLTTTLETEKDLPMRVGQRITLSGYTFIFQALKDIKGPNYEGKQGHFTIYRDQQPIADLYPEKRFYIPREVAMTETAIKAGFLRDFYIALGEKLDDRWSVRLYIKPFIRWVWLGGLLIALGAGCISFVSFREHLSKRAE